MQSRDLIESRFVKGPANQPALVPIAVEIALPQILDPDKAFRWIMKIDFRNPNSMGVEKLRDLDVVPVFFALQIVFNQDQLLVRGAIDSIKFSVRASFFDWLDCDLIDIQTRKMHSRLSEKQRRFHWSDLDVDVAMDAASLFFGADNTTLKLTLGSNLCARPQNCVFEDDFRADSALLCDNRTAAQLRAGIDSG
jgi:hypothetical protein